MWEFRIEAVIATKDTDVTEVQIYCTHIIYYNIKWRIDLNAAKEDNVMKSASKNFACVSKYNNQYISMKCVCNYSYTLYSNDNFCFCGHVIGRRLAG